MMDTTGNGRVVYTDQDGDGIYDDVVYVVPQPHNEQAQVSSHEAHYQPQPPVHQVAQSALPRATTKDYKRAAKIAFAFLAIAIVAFIAHAIKFLLF